MKERINFIAIDVDDKSFHGCGINSVSKEVREFSCRPTVGHLAKKLSGFTEEGSKLKVCYEATYVGFSLQRELTKRGYTCEVIAPSLIPERRGERVKTDRLDCRKMAEYYSHDQLTVIHIPSVEEEMVRDLVRTRRFISRQMRALKLHILSTCRRLGWNYRESESGGKVYWTKKHREWLLSAAKDTSNRQLNFNMITMLNQLEQMERQIGLYDQEMAHAAEHEPYQEKVIALSCYRGVDLLTAMTLITELGDIKRFKHPRQLCSYAGMELTEYSSGGHERRYRMSKMGNKHVRTSVIEACQLASKVPHISKSLKARRKGATLKYIEIADRCMHRLYKKSWRLLNRNKMANKVKVACAREMLCFVWESLNAVAA